MKPYLLVAADFVQTGGMDIANFALAHFIAEQGHDVHLVTQRAAEQLTNKPNIIVHRVPKPAGSYLLAEPLMNRIGRFWAAKVTAQGGRVLVNGGNCRWGDINWVHYVHAAYRLQSAGGALSSLKNQCKHQVFLREEQAALRRARIVITNSERTKRDVIEHVGVPAERVHTVYYGIDEHNFHPPTADERDAARKMLGWPDGKPMVAFIGALGDRRKGLDTLFAAWEVLCADRRWDADLVIVGTGAELHAWRIRAADAGLKSRVHFLGFRSDVPTILAACDALVAPTRYEAYGLGVQEAICCGLPAFVTRSAGVAERYPADLADLLLDDPPNAADVSRRLRSWRSNIDHWKDRLLPLTTTLRRYTWADMAGRIVSISQ